MAKKIQNHKVNIIVFFLRKLTFCSKNFFISPISDRSKKNNKETKNIYYLYNEHITKYYKNKIIIFVVKIIQATNYTKILN